ncbi:MAG: alpha/beta hydrolase [Halioglobus sp.]|nr:alpha/beta hydrolase [Halioglobus sp.]
MTEKYINANGIELAYEEFGDSADPAILLIMGLGTQMIGWPEHFCAGLAAQGYRVIRFDNRDIGLSQKMDTLPTPAVLKVMLFARLKLPLAVPYTLEDMAHDAVSLLDALNIKAAHLVGASMGGMIAQLVAGYFPSKVLSLTSIMSTSGRKSLPGPDRKIALHMLRRPAKADAESMHEYAMRTWRLIGSPAYPPTDEALSEKISRSYQRSYYPAGHSRQMVAIMAGGDRVKALTSIVAPTLVIHGKADPLVPVSGGIDTARLVPGAKLELIEGMGHDLPDELIPRFVKLIGSNAAAVTPPL